MSSLIYELTKQSTTIERLPKLDGVFSSFRTDKFAIGAPSHVYGVQPQHGFPKECNPNGLNNIAYFGVSAFNDKLHIIDFLYEERYKDGFRVGILEPALQMLKDAQVDLVTIGQYLAPSPNHLPVDRFPEPSQYDDWSREIEEMGFLGWACGPLVRSSYKAGELLSKASARLRTDKE